MTPCHICGRKEPKAFASNVCADREPCIDLGRTRLGMNAQWYRTKEKYPWMDRKGKSCAR